MPPFQAGYEEVCFRLHEKAHDGIIAVRVSGEIPDALLQKLIRAVGEMHKEKEAESLSRYEHPRYIWNNCYDLNRELARKISRLVPGSRIDVIEGDRLSARDSAIVYPDGWCRPVSFANHFIAYQRSPEGCHIAADITALDYLAKRNPPLHANADIIAAPSFPELEKKLKCYYGGNRWVPYRPVRYSPVRLYEPESC